MTQPVTKLASCRERQACGTMSCLSFLQWCMWCSHWCCPKRECAVFFLVNASWPKQWQSPHVFLTLTLLTPLMGIVRIMYTPSEDVKDARPCFCLEFSSLRASLHSSPYALVELLKLLLYRHFYCDLCSFLLLIYTLSLSTFMIPFSECWATLWTYRKENFPSNNRDIFLFYQKRRWLWLFTGNLGSVVVSLLKFCLLGQLSLRKVGAIILAIGRLKMVTFMKVLGEGETLAQ